MDSFDSYLLRRLYSSFERLGDRLARVESLIDWEAFRPVVKGLFVNDTERGGRPNVDEVVMVKLLVLQHWYGLSDEELERQANDRISFRRFLGYPEEIPDSTTVWLFRDGLAQTGKDREIWEELQRQLDGKGLRVRKGVAQDATFIAADPGKASKPRGEEARTRRSRDGDWAKRRNGSVFGYKAHVKEDLDQGLMRDLETTSASGYDSRVDLSRPGEVVYRDKGYFGVKPKGHDATMRRGVRGHPLGIRDRLRNRRISRRRAPVERAFSVMKRVFDAGHMLVTTRERVHVKLVFTCLCFNLLQMSTLARLP
jgi:IS5 family transposase